MADPKGFPAVLAPCPNILQVFWLAFFHQVRICIFLSDHVWKISLFIEMAFSFHVQKFYLLLKQPGCFDLFSWSTPVTGELTSKSECQLIEITCSTTWGINRTYKKWKNAYTPSRPCYCSCKWKKGYTTQNDATARSGYCIPALVLLILNIHQSIHPSR